MPFAITVERFPQYVRFSVCGPASLKNYYDLVEEAARQTIPQGDKKVLIDLRKVVGRLNFTDQFFIGGVVAQKLGHLQKLCVVVTEDPASYHSETVARRGGANLRNFNSEQAAIDFLLQEAEHKQSS